MSCNNLNCVCQVVREIDKVQDEVANNNNNGCCTTSCEKSIQELLSPAQNNNNNNAYTTIPFMLTCKGGCDLFFGSGVYTDTTNGGRNFNLVTSPVFRVKEFVNDNDCCARVELLLPYDGATPVQGAEDEIASFFDNNGTIENFIATGVCITVDLNCYCAISCLDPITPVPSSQFAG